MTHQVYNLHSTVEIPLPDLKQFLSQADLPDDVDSLTTTESGNIVEIKSESSKDDIGTYTPTAVLKATVSDKTEVVDDVEDGGLWSKQVRGEDDEQKTETTTYAGFKGHGETVLYNNALQYQMFTLLCDIAKQEEATGEVSAAVVKDGEMEPVKIVDGERKEATIDIVQTENRTQEPKKKAADYT